MPLDEDDIRAFKSAVFNTGSNPGRQYIEFFAQVMDWPVDKYAPQTVFGPGISVEHRVSWLKGEALGFATCTVVGGESTASAWVRPLHTIVRAEIGAAVDNDPLSPSTVRTLKLHFTDGEKFVLDLLTFVSEAQRGPADEFIDSVLAALSQPRSSA